jgi:hypothetical protein
VAAAGDGAHGWSQTDQALALYDGLTFYAEREAPRIAVDLGVNVLNRNSIQVGRDLIDPAHRPPPEVSR